MTSNVSVRLNSLSTNLIVFSKSLSSSMFTVKLIHKLIEKAKDGLDLNLRVYLRPDLFLMWRPKESTASLKYPLKTTSHHLTPTGMATIKNRK